LQSKSASEKKSNSGGRGNICRKREQKNGSFDYLEKREIETGATDVENLSRRSEVVSWRFIIYHGPSGISLGKLEAATGVFIWRRQAHGSRRLMKLLGRGSRLHATKTRITREMRHHKGQRSHVWASRSRGHSEVCCFGVGEAKRILMSGPVRGNASRVFFGTCCWTPLSSPTSASSTGSSCNPSITCALWHSLRLILTLPLRGAHTQPHDFFSRADTPHCLGMTARNNILVSDEN
jgi:hypothetical protein